MKQCPKCNNNHTKPGLYCCRSCANSRQWTEEINKKRSATLAGRKIGNGPHDIEKWKANIKQTWLKKYKSMSFDELGPENKRRRVFEEQQFCCARCGVSEWFSKQIPLELEHKDGNNQNNDRNNLEGLCPNCHSITDTWRGRNKPAKNGLNEITDEFLLKCLNESKNIRQGLLKAGIAAKGNNYQRAKKLLGL